MRDRSSSIWAYCPFTLAMLLIDGALFAVTAALSHDVFNIRTAVLMQFGASQPEGLWEGEWYRLVAPMFLHGGLLHIVFNLNFLYRAGPPTEIYFGTSNFGTIYLLSGVTGVVFSQVFGGGVSIGASTSLLGIMGAHLAVAVLRAPVLRHAWRDSNVRANAYNAGFIFAVGLAGTFLSPGSFLGRMDNLGHFGGFVGGLALGFAFELMRNRSRWGQPLLVATLLLTGVLVCGARWSVFSPKYHLFRGAVAADDAGNKAAAKPDFERARACSAAWKGWYWMGVLNPSETATVIQAFERGMWNHTNARTHGMGLITRLFRRARSDADEE